MSNIRVDLNTPIQDGTEVVFRSPVDCSQVTGLKVYYPGGSREFAFADAHGNNVGDIDHLFTEDVAVKVILDVRANKAFVQNADTNAYLEGRFTSIEERLADLLYEEISVTSYTVSPNVAELGSTVRSVTMSWVLNKEPTALTVGGTNVSPVKTGTRTVSGLSQTENRSWQLVATDERSVTVTRNATLYFYNGVYYGVGAAQENVDSAFIRSLTKTLRGSKLPNFTVTAAEGQYIYYCVPTRFGKCTFTVGGFTGGFTEPETVSFTNASGYTEDYYVYRSVNAGLGSQSVTVS